MRKLFVSLAYLAMTSPSVAQGFVLVLHRIPPNPTAMVAGKRQPAVDRPCTTGIMTVWQGTTSKAFVETLGGWLAAQAEAKVQGFLDRPDDAAYGEVKVDGERLEAPPGPSHA
jgi:hypothetical protein